MEIIGETIDDAAGEAFDKAAKMLKLPYPGGPLIDRHARGGNSARFRFAEPQVDGLNFSFSGFKTSVLYFLQRELRASPHFIEENLADICASVQQTIVQILIKKLALAAAQTGITNLCLAGGVSANSALRQQFATLGRQKGWNTFIPPFEYCTDNAAMIALTAHYKYKAGQFADLSLSASARSEWPLQ
jgi:N6-L-threonylcarbamoyladenine synthase